MTKRYHTVRSPVHADTIPPSAPTIRLFQTVRRPYQPLAGLALVLTLAACLAGFLGLADLPAPVSAQPGSEAEVERVGSAAQPEAGIAEEYVFERQEVGIGPAARQTVLTGFLLEGAVADLVVVKIAERGDRRVRIFSYEPFARPTAKGDDAPLPERRKRFDGNGRWTLGKDAPLRPGVLFVDIARIGSRQRLITCEAGRVNVWDPESSAEYKLVDVKSNFVPPHPGEVPHVDISRDVNGDELDDLIVPAGDGFQIFIQLADGKFADPVKVGPFVVLDRIYGADGYKYDPWSASRIHAFDYNGDDRVDLVSWNGYQFEAHLQDARGRFDATPTVFTTGVRFDSDDFSTLADGDMAGRALHSFSDLNGDDVADMVVYALAGERIADKRSAYEVHFGARTLEDRTHFAPEVDLEIQSEGAIQLALERRDFDGDGEVDLVVTTIDTRYLEDSLFKRIRGFMGDDVWLQLAFYRSEGGAIPDRPVATRRIQLDGAPSPREPGWVPLNVVLRGGKHVLRRERGKYTRAFNKNLFIGDVTGNGRSDLLIEWTHREMHVFPGIPGPNLFARRPQKVAVEMPNDEEYAWMADLNRDDRQDIVMHHPFKRRDAHGAPEQPPGTEPHHVTLLIAR